MNGSRRRTRQEIVEDFLGRQPSTLFGRSWDIKVPLSRAAAATWLVSVLDDLESYLDEEQIP